MSAVSVTWRRTVGRLRAQYASVFARAGFFLGAGGLLAFHLDAGEGGPLGLPVLLALSASQVLPALVAVLAMDVWSEDRQTGRVDLLLTVAVRERAFVLGKFLGVWSLSVFTVFLFDLLAVSAIRFFVPENVSIDGLSAFVPGFVCLVLQAALWSAVAVLSSALFNRSAVAALFAFTITLVLPRAGWLLLQSCATGGRTLFGDMPLDAFTIDFAQGVVSFGWLLVGAVGLGVLLFITTQRVTLLRLVGRGARMVRFTTRVTIWLSVVFLVLTGVLARHVDFTLNLETCPSTQEVSQRLRGLLQEAGGEIDVTAFLPRSDMRFRALASALRRVRAVGDSLGGVRIRPHFVDPHWDLGAADRLVRLGVAEGSVVFERNRHVRTISVDEGLNEALLVATLHQLLLPPQHRHVYWTAGHGEGSYSDYGRWGLSDIARELTRRGYVNCTLDLSAEAQLPADCAFVVVAGPKNEFSRAELGRLDAYLRKGGRLLVLTRAAAEGGVSALLSSWGVRMFVQPIPGARTLSGSDVIVTEFADHPIVASLNGSSVVLDRPVLFAPSARIAGGAGVDRLEFRALASVGESVVAALVERSPGVGDDLSLRPVRLVVLGDESAVQNGALARRANANQDLFLNAAAYLSGSEIPRSGGDRTGALALGLARGERARLVQTLVAGLPLAYFLFLACGVCIRRRRG